MLKELHSPNTAAQKSLQACQHSARSQRDSASKGLQTTSAVSSDKNISTRTKTLLHVQVCLDNSDLHNSESAGTRTTFRRRNPASTELCFNNLDTFAIPDQSELLRHTCTHLHACTLTHKHNCVKAVFAVALLTWPWCLLPAARVCRQVTATAPILECAPWALEKATTLPASWAVSDLEEPVV